MDGLAPWELVQVVETCRTHENGYIVVFYSQKVKLKFCIMYCWLFDACSTSSSIPVTTPYLSRNIRCYISKYIRRITQRRSKHLSKYYHNHVYMGKVFIIILLKRVIIKHWTLVKSYLEISSTSYTLVRIRLHIKCLDLSI